MPLPKRLNWYGFLYWLIAHCRPNCLGSFYLCAVCSPFDTHIYTWGITASQEYSQYPLSLGGSCGLYKVEPCPGSQGVDKSIHSCCPGDSSISLAMGAFLLHTTRSVPQKHSRLYLLDRLLALEKILWYCDRHIAQKQCCTEDIALVMCLT